MSRGVQQLVVVAVATIAVAAAGGALRLALIGWLS